jgi:hypothetical protein
MRQVRLNREARQAVLLSQDFISVPTLGLVIKRSKMSKQRLVHGMIALQEKFHESEDIIYL